ncbi:MAG TPA: putative LPS assembly protein LptD, partial [Gemmatimonadaceae bacterium]|nr:putative LPS assembly protein LptD [Gemmatimonadaceae bacterium]
RADSVRRAGLPGDTARRDRRDSTQRDSAQRMSDRIEWAATDSVMEELLSRRGYSATRYQGQSVRFDAGQRTIYLEGRRAAVRRADQILAGDTILYNDSTDIVEVRGDTLVLRDPSQGQDDLIAYGLLRYDLLNRRGLTRRFETTTESGGQNWRVIAHRGAAWRTDTTAIPDSAGKFEKRNTFYVRGGTFTSCEDSTPHYHFEAREIKVVQNRLIVARPAVLYIADVPVMWLPFVFQDMRSGRRSGILSPRLGFSEIVRNNANYRRHVENVGYYFALNDYMDAQAWLDWRSSARATPGDPGWIQYTGEWHYRWLDRFLSGSMAASHQRVRDGQRMTNVSWQHQQEFSQRTRLSSNINYSTNTNVQRNTTLNPYAVLATIRSQANYQTQVGPLSMSLGGDRTQYPGRPQVDLNFPSLNLASQGPLNVLPWLVWTPTLSLSNSTRQNVTGASGFRYFTTASGSPDSVAVNADTRNTSIQISTPLRIFKFDWSNSISIADQENDAPTSITVEDTTRFDASGRPLTTRRFYARSYRTAVDWQTSFALPQFFQGTWNLTPSVSVENVTGEPFMIRTTLSGADFVRQSKRLRYSLSSSPTIFGLFPGFGPVSRFRHALTPTLSWGYAPAASVSDKFKRAANLGSTSLAGLPSNQITLGLSQNIEAKLRSKSDTNPDAGRKIKLLSLNFSPVSYDFVRADTTGNGFTTTTFSYDASSELLPGFSFRSSYSLFQGDPTSDTAVFKPFRENVSASFNVNRNSGIFAALTRVFGRAVPASAPELEHVEQEPTQDAFARQAAAAQVAGSRGRSAQLGVPAGQGWQASFSFTSSRQRPIVGLAEFSVDAAQCLDVVPVSQPTRLAECQLNPTNFFQQNQLLGADPNLPSLVRGTQIFRQPSLTSLQSQMSFNITPKWAAQWSTTYDFHAKDFASQQVQLQRELHDWRAIFAFTRAPNGNFAFNFFISLKAQPDIKFDYDQQSYRRAGGAR